MLYFKGYGNKDNKQWSRNQIIQSGFKHNANIFKVNKTLTSFNASELTNQEALEYIIQNSIDDMTINSKQPTYSDFGLAQSDINFIKKIKNVYFLNIITILLFSIFISSSIGFDVQTTAIIGIILYGMFGIAYVNFSKKYKSINKKIDLFNSVQYLYCKKYAELQEIIRQEEEAERKKQEELQRIIWQKEEEERQKQELLARQRLNYWENIINNTSMSTSERGQIFEREMTELFKQLGWKVKLTQASKDGGVDIILDMNGEICVVQCKFHKSKIGVEPVRALWGVKDSFNADRVMMLAYAGTTKGGEEFIAEKNYGRSKENWLYKICDINDVMRWYHMAEKRQVQWK